MTARSWSACLLVLGLSLTPTPAVAQPKADRPRMLVGIEYVFLGGGKAFGELGVPLAKPYGEFHEWGAMQKSKDAAIDFRRLDALIKEYQDAGFTEFYLSLKANSEWASRDVKKLVARNTVPKKEHWALYEAWVRALVERYGTLGAKAMPGLKRPARFFEIGTEFSSFQPEPTGEYLEMLERGYKAAKGANPKVMVLHAAFMPTTAFRNHPKPVDYPKAFAAMDKRLAHKSLDDIRAVLDHPEWFDAVNFHALADPGEIEDAVAWLKHEMERRRYQRPIVISDTSPNPLIGWGSAIHAKGPAGLLGVLMPPATEDDRPRLAAYFKKLVAGDKETVEWNHAFVAADMVQRVVIAAEQGVLLINTAFTEDHPLFQKLAAGEGTAAWAGMADVKLQLNDTRKVLGLRPNFYALQQLQKHLGEYSDLKRVPAGDKSIRLYRWIRGKTPVWVAWLDPGKVVLPGDQVPEKKLTLKTGPGDFHIEPMIARSGQTRPEPKAVTARDGVVEMIVMPRPIFVTRPPVRP